MNKNNTETELSHVKYPMKSLSVAIEALEFYSNIACHLPTQLNDNEEVESMRGMDRVYFQGGRHARQALKEIRCEE